MRTKASCRTCILRVFVAKPFWWNTKGWRVKQQGGNNLSKTSFNIRVHSKVCPNIYTRLLMSSDIKVLVWGRLPDSSLLHLRPPPLWHAGLHSLYPLSLCSSEFDMIEKCYMLKSKLKIWIMPNYEHDFIKIGQHKLYSWFIYLSLVDIFI